MKRSNAATAGSINVAKHSLLSALLSGLLLTTAVGAEQRQLGAHLHGLAELNIAIEQQEMTLELVTPAANLLGFEHPARSADERRALQLAVKALKEGPTLFAPAATAGCRQAAIVMDSPLLEYQNQQQDQEHEHEHEHEHEAMLAPHAHPNQTGATGAVSEAQAAESGHSEFHVTYRFHCDDPENLTSLRIGLWQHFSGFQQLRVQLLTDNSQRLLYLSRDDVELKL